MLEDHNQSQACRISGMNLGILEGLNGWEVGIPDGSFKVTLDQLEIVDFAEKE